MYKVNLEKQLSQIKENKAKALAQLSAVREKLNESSPQHNNWQSWHEEKTKLIDEISKLQGEQKNIEYKLNTL